MVGRVDRLVGYGRTDQFSHLRHAQFHAQQPNFVENFWKMNVNLPNIEIPKVMVFFKILYRQNDDHIFELPYIL